MTAFGESDNPARSNKIRPSTNGEYRLVRSRHKNLRALRRSGLADVDDLAPWDITSGVDLFHDDGTVVPRLPLYRLLHCPVKRIIGKADRECAVPRGKCPVWPLDEFREVIKKSGFDLIFDGPVLYCGRIDAKQDRKGGCKCLLHWRLPISISVYTFSECTNAFAFSYFSLPLPMQLHRILCPISRNSASKS